MLDGHVKRALQHHALSKLAAETTLFASALAGNK